MGTKNKAKTEVKQFSLSVEEYIVMPTGSNSAKFDGAVALNEVSALIFEQLKNSVCKEDLTTALLNEYEVG